MSKICLAVGLIVNVVHLLSYDKCAKKVIIRITEVNHSVVCEFSLRSSEYHSGFAATDLNSVTKFSAAVTLEMKLFNLPREPISGLFVIE